MAQDTGERLLSLYAASGGVATVFSSKAEDYAASRPDYPSALFDALRDTIPLTALSLIADVGAGTGLLTLGLLRRGYKVRAIEPSEPMRLIADRLCGGYTGYRSASGTAEELPLEPSSVDLITAAQAFHWFKVEEARAEFLRVLRPEAKVALIWNDRVSSEPLQVALDALFLEHGGERRSALAAHEERGQVPIFFGSNSVTRLSWPHEHSLDEAGLSSLAFSRSYMPARDSPAGQEAGRELGRIFQRFSLKGKVAVRYRTVAMIGRPAIPG
jgi:SAM-dependent methyltransferase